MQTPVYIPSLAELQAHCRGPHFLDQARGIELLVRPVNDGGLGMSHRAVADKLGKSSSWVRNMLRLLKLPDVIQDEARVGGLSFRQARALASFADDSQLLMRVVLERNANPQAWRTAEDFEANLRKLVDLMRAQITAKERGGAAYPSGPAVRPEASLRQHVPPTESSGASSVGERVSRRNKPLGAGRVIEAISKRRGGR